MDGFDIRRIMTAKKITGASIARKIGVAVPTISEVIHGRSTSRRISQAVADAVDVPVGELFPMYQKEKGNK